MASKTPSGRLLKPEQLLHSRRLPLLMTPALHAALHRYCIRHNSSAGAVLREALTRFLASEAAGHIKKGGK